MPDDPPLAGIKVVDFTRYLAGPFRTQIPGDYGAETIKVEPVDGARGEMGGDSGKDSYFFMSTNRSKKSVQISTRNAEGRAVLERLIDSADVVVDNFRPGVMDAMGRDRDMRPAGRDLRGAGNPSTFARGESDSLTLYSIARSA